MKKKYKLNLSSLDKKHIISCNILCIGDIMLDHYLHGQVTRMSPEAPIPILLYEDEKFILGGVGNVARNIASIGAKCTLLSLIGKDFASDKIKQLIINEKRINSKILSSGNFKTPIKTRFIKNLKHLLRVDYELPNFIISKYLEKRCEDILKKNIDKSDLIILSDYNKGFLNKSIIKKIVNHAKNNNKIIIADPKKSDFSVYAGIDILTPNEKEISEAARRKLKSENEIITFARKIIVQHKIGEILITRSSRGMLLVGINYAKKIKTEAKKVVDVTGAGDTVISILAVMKACGFSTFESATISNKAAGIIIGKKETAVLSYNELI